MMDYATFKAVAEKKILDYFPDSFKNATVEIKPITKVNKTKDAITIFADDDMKTAPNFYLNDMYEHYKSCEDLEEVFSKVAASYVREFEAAKDFKLPVFSKEFVSENVFMTMVNTESNKELLEKTVHRDINDCSVIYRIMTNTTEEKEPDKDEQAENNNSEAEENSDAESGKAEVSNTDSNNKTAKTDSISCSPEDIAKAMEPMFMKLTEGLTEVLKPDDNRFSAEIDRLERQVKELRSDLASSVGVIKSKESEIGRLREEMAKMKAGHEDSNAAPLVREPKPTADINLKSAKDIKNTPEDNSNIVNNQSTKKAEIFGNYRTVLKTADGREIPVQIEKSEARRPGGMMAMAARLFGGTPSQKALLNMLIDKRLTPEQLKQIKRAKDSRFSEEELKDLIESGLPAEEMAGIIDVIVSDRG